MLYTPKAINPIFLTDSYKLSHIRYTTPGVKIIYSNFTPRYIDYLLQKYPDFDGNLVWFGLQGTLKQVFFDSWDENFFKRDKDEVIQEAKDILGPYIGMENLKHFEALHDLGYMPIEIKALPEGSLVQPGIPCFTIRNTHDDFQWIPNYLESIITVQLWKVMTVATVSKIFKDLAEDFSMQTKGNIEGVNFQNHDFSLRGQSGYESAGACGAAFLTGSDGTDNVPALHHIQQYYNSNLALKPVAFSIPAGEHSVTTLGIQIHKQHIANEQPELPLEKLLVLAEHAYLEEVLLKFPEGPLAYVADSYNYFAYLTETLPLAKDSIMSRNGTLVVRGDSGDPVEIIAGIKVPDYSEESDVNNAAHVAFFEEFKHSEEKRDQVESKFFYNGICYKIVYNVYYDSRGLLDSWQKESLSEYTLTPEEKGTVEILWDIFGGTVNELGYKVLDSHIGCIYGDGITYQRALEIFTRLKSKGFVSTNVVFGIGAYSLSLLSRDDLGIAVKATAAIYDSGETDDHRNLVNIYKDPKTDSSKKSAKGLLQIIQDKDTGKFILNDEVNFDQMEDSCLKTVFLNGKFTKEFTFEEVRQNLYG